MLNKYWHLTTTKVQILTLDSTEVLIPAPVELLKEKEISNSLESMEGQEDLEDCKLHENCPSEEEGEMTESHW